MSLVLASEQLRPRFYPELEGARVLVTGVRENCGLELGRAFARHGTNLITQFDEPQDIGFELAHKLESEAMAFRFLQCDFDNVDSITRFSDTAMRAFQGLDVIINVVGSRFNPLGAGQIAETEEQLETVVSNELRSAWHMTRQIATRMRDRGMPATIINAAILPSSDDPRNLAHRAVLKTALENIAANHAAEFKDDGIQVNTVILNADPALEVDDIDDLMAIDPVHGELTDALSSTTVIGDIDFEFTDISKPDPVSLDEDDMIAAVLFLASDQGQRFSGLTLSVSR